MAFHHAPGPRAQASTATPTAAAWVAFALVFGLMLSDYLSRQVINAVFPFIKAEWQLSDTALGSLVSIVALTVGVFSFPVSVLADRFGRVLCVTALGDNVRTAQNRAYEITDDIRFDGMQFRRDIGHRAIKR